MQEINSDLHCHPSLKGAGSNRKPKDIWKAQEPSAAFYKLNKSIQKAIGSIARGSQANLEACVDGNARLLFTSIYPFERPFLQIEPQKPFKLLFKFILPGKKYNLLGEAALGIPAEKIKTKLEEARKDSGVNYFTEYEEELDYLVSAQATKSDNEDYQSYSFQMAKDYDHFSSLMKDENKVAGILTIEGAHALGNYAFKDPFDCTYEELTISEEKKTLLEDSFLENIKKVKNSIEPGTVPFFITFSHHFNNLLAGHATSLSDKSSLIRFIRKFHAPGMRHLFNQMPNRENGFSSLGIKVVKAILSRENGRRILIDTKHMSVRSRKEFYQLLDQEYADDPIPIVHSHAAVNGWQTLDKTMTLSSNSKLDNGQFFSRWTINITDEDIEVTFKSDGLIGVCLHEGRMPGGAFKDQMKKWRKEKSKEQKRGKNTDLLDEKINDLYLKLFWSNIFHIAKIQLGYVEQENLVDRDNWSGITIGSDYDGIVDPFDDYSTIAEYPELRVSMIKYINEGKDILHVADGRRMDEQEIVKVMNGKTVNEIVEQIFYGNVNQFLSSYFTGDYLESKENVASDLVV